MTAERNITKMSKSVKPKRNKPSFNPNKLLSAIKSRCKHDPRYTKKKIKCLITADELQRLYVRDKGHFLKKPSIDRIDSDGNYEPKNCRFIEHSLNSSLGRSSGFGVKNHASKITDKDVIEIRGNGSLTNKEIGKLYGLSDTAVFYIRHGITWKHVKTIGNIIKKTEWKRRRDS